MKTIKLDRCPTCGESQTEEAGLALLRCTTCGTVRAALYADPDEVFKEGYLSGGTGSFGIDVSHPRFQAYLAAVGEQRCGLIEKWQPVGSLLDVGCGSGELLAVAARRGWRAAGAEPLVDASELARSRGLDVRTGLVQDVGFEEGAWDVVTAFHVLEHMPDAPEFLELLARFARPGGLVVIESPNFDAIARGRYGKDWMHLRPLEHLVHWTPETLRSAFEIAGLEPVGVRTPHYLYRDHTIDEALQLIGRPQWKPWISRLPKAAVRGVATVQDRFGRGAVVLGTARRPA
jgi:SAM-dependent methyltransferase